MAETLRSGGVEYEATWLRCMAAASFKQEEAIVSVDAVDVPSPLDFFVDRELVRPDELLPAAVDGQVKVIVVERNGGTSRVSIPGEPLSFGPQITVRNDLFI